MNEWWLVVGLAAVCLGMRVTAAFVSAAENPNRATRMAGAAVPAMLLTFAVVVTPRGGSSVHLLTVVAALAVGTALSLAGRSLPVVLVAGAATAALLRWLSSIP